MATYALTFATRAAFDTSLASGDIYNLMQGVTSSKPSVAITATITESGETFACGTNVMVDIKSVGPGDRVMYDSTNKKFFGIASKWIDNNYPAQPTQHIMIFKAGVLPARYVDCGVCVRRFGNRIRLAGTQQNLPWTSTNTSTSAAYAWNVPTIASKTDVIKKSRTTVTDINTTSRVCFPSQRYQEAMYPSGQASYMPITRAEWNTAANAGNPTVTGNGKTVTLADFDMIFDKYLAYNFAPLYPASAGAYVESDGMSNTRKIVAEFVANHGKTENSDDYAAGYCYNYAVSAPGLGKRQWFLGVIKDVGEIIAIRHTLPTALAWGSGYFWAASQYSNSNAWVIAPLGISSSLTKDYQIGAVPLADLILEN